jgi:phytoene synthase
MNRWREALTAALAGHPDAGPVWPAFLDAVARYKIPHEYFHDMIEGVASDLSDLSDLSAREFHTFDELYRYCYRVASVVGLTTIHIFGFDSPAALPLAEKCGIAFQLTNILRDIREDAGLGRVYLPSEDLARFGVVPEDLTRARRTDAFADLMDFEIARARDYYRESTPLIGLVHEESRGSLRALIAIYSGLLERIAETPMDVLTRRISLPVAEKIWIVIRSALGS